MMRERSFQHLLARKSNNSFMHKEGGYELKEVGDYYSYRRRPDAFFKFA